MIKAMCIGDSISLPREEVKYEETWFYLLKKACPELDLISYFKRAITTNILFDPTMGFGSDLNKYPYGSDCLEFFDPDIIVLQLGIVDCAPRLIYHKLEKYLVRKMPVKIKSTYLSLIKKTRKRSPHRTDVSLERFEKNLLNYLSRCSVLNIKKAILIAIPTPSSKMTEKNNHIAENVIRYNKCMERVANKFSFTHIVNPLNPASHDKDIYVDGYHPNGYGNSLIFQAVKSSIFNE